MDQNRKEQLISLGPEILADSLLELAERSDSADDLVERLIAGPKENLKRFKKKLSNLKNSRFSWKDSSRLVRKLEMLLKDLEASSPDPLTGVELVAKFYEEDKTIMELCDDSYGNVGGVFQFDAKDLFLEYASQCDDKEKVADLILNLNKEDDYGVRDVLIDCAKDCLPESVIRSMITTLNKWAHSVGGYQKRHNLILIESLARQIKDAKLFEETRIEFSGEPSTSSIIEIARVYLDSEDVNTANEWINKISKDDSYNSYERDKLLFEIYQKQGDTKKLTDLLCKIFKSHHSIKTLEELLNVIGEDNREDVIQKEIPLILEKERLNLSDVKFLIEVQKFDEADEYILKRSDQLDGDSYVYLIPVSETLESEGRNLAASLINRSMLVSILDRGYSKAYPHGVRYLKKLDKLATNITDWKDFLPHESFKEQIFQVHKRKKSFWNQYD